MNASRVALIPIAHVAAEVLAYPLASEAALELGLTSLSPSLGGTTSDLWRRAEQDLLSRHPSIALDELVAIRDDIWFKHGQEPSLGSYLRGAARRFLESRGARAVPRLDLETAGPPGPHGDGIARTFWRWLTFALPPDLLLAALDPAPSGPSMVDTVSPLLDRRLLDKGFAEPHVHLNGCFDFGRIWVSTLRGLAERHLADMAFKNPGAALREGMDMADWLLRAAVARYVLAAFLVQRRGEEDLRSFFRITVLDRIGLPLVQALKDLREGRLPERSRFRSIQFLYRSLIDAWRNPKPAELDEVWDCDPIFPLLHRGARPPETQWLALGLRYLEETQSKDALFARLFWQTVRVRCLFYRHLVQRPMTPGLQWFVRFFKRIKPARHLFDIKLRAHLARELCGGEHGLCSLEVRTSPDAKGLSATYREVREVTEALRPEDKKEPQGEPVRDASCEHGIVWHFGRDREGGWFDGKPKAHWSGTAADPEIRADRGKKDTSTGYRYGFFYKQKRAEALAAARVLSFYPRSLEVVRGLDLCTDEVGVPSWVMAPLIRHVRDASRLASATLRERLGRDVPPLRTAVHAGEDFVHLLTGLRRLDEAIEHLKLAEGDRLGHALCLGVDPEQWAARAGRLAIPREDRLFDLAWEWNWYSRCGRAVPGDRYALIQRETLLLTRQIFGEPPLGPDRVGEIVEGLHDEARLRSLGFPDRPYPAAEQRDNLLDGLLFRYLTSPVVFQRGREIVWIDPKEEAAALTLLQNELRRKVGQIGLTIEVNPSSNLLIGHLADVAHHPLWRLSPPGDGDGIPPLAVCIGSDDPLTFSTTLREEYQLLYDALLSDGHSEAVAHRWLERAREAGMSARFTLEESRRPWSVQERRFSVLPRIFPHLPP